MREAQSAWEHAQQSGAVAKIGEVDNYVFGLTEAFEFMRIYEAFRHEPKERVAPKLLRALSGPSRLIDETKKNSDGRNMTFELAFAADWRLHGLDVELEEPDLVLRTKGFTFYTACKRPFRVESIRANVRDAQQQIVGQLETKSEGFGLIVISTSRIFSSGHKIFFARTMGDQRQLGDFWHNLLLENRGRFLNISFNPRIAGVVFHVSTPSDVGGGDQLAFMSFSNGYQIGDLTAFRALDETMRALYPETT